MYPVILSIGPFSIFSYGLMLAVAAAVCYFLMMRDARKINFSSDVVSDLIFWPLLGGLLGARIFYVFLNLDYFLQYPLEVIMLHHGGLAWQGGLVGGGGAFVVFAKRNKLDLLFVADFGAPYIALGQAIGRLGCFLNGCCQGKEVPWGIYFPVHHARLHPTQLYSFVALVLIFFLLKRMRRLSLRQGQLLAIYLMLAAFQRFVIQFFRADGIGQWGNLSIYHFVCFFIFGAGAVLYLVLRKRPKKGM